MLKMINKSEPVDVKVLSLMHVDMSSFMTDDISKYGEFISLNNYQYINVEDVDSVTKDYIEKAYEILDDKRPNDSFIRLEQGILLFGAQRNQEFWNNKQNIEWLFITLVHFSNDSKEEFEKFEKMVSACFAKNDIESNQWSLYYALDFCDVVLFVKNAPLECYQDALWDFTQVDPGEKPRIKDIKERIVRDTISIYGINSSVVKKKFADFENGIGPQKRECCDSFDLSLFLSVQNNGNFGSFTEVINSYKPKIYRKFGRSDLALFVEKVQLEDAIYISWAAIKKGGNKANCKYKPAFDSCMISPMSKVQSEKLGFICDSGKNESTEYMTFLFSAISVSKQLSALSKPLGEELAGICNSLLPMMKDSLAEEFYLSVLPSFLVYLKITKDCIKAIIQNKNQGSIEWMQYLDQYVGIQGDYFRTLIMIDHSILHSEKRFFQAPALNAFVCSIPPKLLALYSSLADRIVDYLHDENNDALYAFVFAPDYKQDVNTKPIECKLVSNAQIGVIYVEEALFYNPEKIIPIMCHEIAHKVGKKTRHREERARRIFKCYAYYMLYNVLPLCTYDKSIEKGCAIFVSILADGMSSCIMKEFQLYEKEEKEYCLRNEATLFSIEAFTKKITGGVELTKDDEFLNKLVGIWLETYSKMVAEKNGRVKNDIDAYIEFILNRLNAYYTSNYWLNSEMQLMTMSTIFRSIAIKINNFFEDTKNINNYAEFCNSILSAFSEAYSDLQMLHIVYGIGIHKTVRKDVRERYQKLIRTQVQKNNYIRDTESSGNEHSVVQNEEQIKRDYIMQFFLRESVLCKVMDIDTDGENDFETKVPEYNSRLIFSCSRAELIKYLKICLNSIRQFKSEDSKRVNETVSKFMNIASCLDIVNIREEIKDYKRRCEEKMIKLRLIELGKERGQCNLNSPSKNGQ